MQKPRQNLSCENCPNFSRHFAVSEKCAKCLTHTIIISSPHFFNIHSFPFPFVIFLDPFYSTDKFLKIFDCMKILEISAVKNCNTLLFDIRGNHHADRNGRWWHFYKLIWTLFHSLFTVVLLALSAGLYQKHHCGNVCYKCAYYRKWWLYHWN